MEKDLINTFQEITVIAIKNYFYPRKLLLQPNPQFILLLIAYF